MRRRVAWQMPESGEFARGQKEAPAERELAPADLIAEATGREHPAEVEAVGTGERTNARRERAHVLAGALDVIGDRDDAQQAIEPDPFRLLLDCGGGIALELHRRVAAGAEEE